MSGANPDPGGSNCLVNLVFPGDGSLDLEGCNTGPNGEIVTAVPNSGSSNYRGTAFGGGMYVELTAQMPSGDWTGTTGWPALWFQPLESALEFNAPGNPAHWAGEAATNYYHLLENDAMEMDGTSSSGHWIASALHEGWGIYNSTCTPAYCKTSGGVTWATTNWTPTTTHKYAMQYVPATGSTSGHVSYYLDGTLQGSQGSLTWSQFQNTGLSPYIPSNMPANNTIGASSPAWLYGVMDTYHYVMILGTGTGAKPFKIIAVNVWQTSSGGNVSN